MPILSNSRANVQIITLRPAEPSIASKNGWLFTVRLPIVIVSQAYIPLIAKSYPPVSVPLETFPLDLLLWNLLFGNEILW